MKKKAKRIAKRNTLNLGMEDSIGYFFKWYRAKHGISQRELANKLKISQPYLTRVEKDQEVFPYNICATIAKSLSIDEKSMLLNCMVNHMKRLIS